MDNLKTPSIFIGLYGDGYISFGSGQPDLPPPERVFKILPNYRSFRYGPVQGQQNLRKALSNQFRNSDENDFVITNGASEAIDLVFRTVCRPGDKVLVHKPFYYSYIPLLINVGLKPIYTETAAGKIDIDDFNKKVGDCKAVLINSPSNPTGRVQDIKTLKEIEKITQDLDMPLISDEVYKDLIYERENYMLSGSHVVTINSFSKTFSMCGARVGYLYSNDGAIVDRVIDLKTHTS